MSMMEERVILHSDLNNFYASVESLYHPEFQNVPLAVGGSIEARHGIILAKNMEAKKYQVKTGEAIWQAQKKCPGLIIIPPDFPKYLKFSKLVKNIYLDYTDRMEPFGIDEAWLDVTESLRLYGNGEKIADTIRQRVKNELGVTCSIGVSYNKIFAKLGSDYKKPDATTLITRDNYRQIVWPLPAEDLLFVGKATKEKLRLMNIHTIGEIALTEQKILKNQFGKCGESLWIFANGLDSSPVKFATQADEVKSVGNSSTAPRDLCSLQEVKILFSVLAESVAARLREQNMRATVVQITIKDNRMQYIERQCKLEQASFLAKDFLVIAMKLFQKHYTWEKPVRALGVRACQLIPAEGAAQLNLFINQLEQEKQENLAKTVDVLRQRFGNHCIKPALLYKDETLTEKDPKEEHIIHPVVFQ